MKASAGLLDEELSHPRKGVNKATGRSVKGGTNTPCWTGTAFKCRVLPEFHQGEGIWEPCGGARLRVPEMVPGLS